MSISTYTLKSHSSPVTKKEVFLDKFFLTTVKPLGEGAAEGASASFLRLPYLNRPDK
jgi:hypothetical protein